MLVNGSVTLGKLQGTVVKQIFHQEAKEYQL